MPQESTDDILLAWKQFFDSRKAIQPALANRYLAYTEKLVRGGFPPIFDLNHLAELIGASPRDLAAQATFQELFYREFNIPKRSGGLRTLAAPSPALFRSQTWIYDNVLSKIELNESCHGFVRGRSIITNARVHAGNAQLLKLDLRDFFPSVTMRRGIAIFMRAGYSPQVSYLLSSLCFFRDKLPQGSPTSPAISNIAAKRMDSRLVGLAKNNQLSYSRYADDMSFSGERIPPKFISKVSFIVSEEGFLLNDEKTRKFFKGRKMIVCGVSISTGTPRLPRSSVREIKKNAFFLLTNGIEKHSVATGTWDPIWRERLIGQVGFWLQLEPENLTAKALHARLVAFDPAVLVAG